MGISGGGGLIGLEPIHDTERAKNGAKVDYDCLANFSLATRFVLPPSCARKYAENCAILGPLCHTVPLELLSRLSRQSIDFIIQCLERRCSRYLSPSRACAGLSRFTDEER